MESQMDLFRKNFGVSKVHQYICLNLGSHMHIDKKS